MNEWIHEFLGKHRIVLKNTPAEINAPQLFDFWQLQLSTYFTNLDQIFQSLDFSGYVTTPPAIYPIIAAWNLLHQTS